MKCKYLILILCVGLICFSGQVFAKYILTRGFDVNITTAPFYFDAEIENAEVELIDKQAEINLTIKNNDGTNYNSYDTNYEISLEEKSEYTIEIQDEYNGLLKGNSLTSNLITAKIKPAEKILLNKVEDVTVLIKSTKPYEKSYGKTISINNTNNFIKVGELSEVGYTENIDCTNIKNWKNLSVENFFLDIEQVVIPGEATGTMTFSKTYNPNTGILTINRSSIVGPGFIITFNCNIYACLDLRLVESKTGNYTATIDCTGVENWQNKTIDDFLIDIKWIDLPENNTGTINFTKKYDSNTGTITITRSSIGGNGTITFGIDVYTL